MPNTDPLHLPAFSLREIVTEICEVHHEADPARLIHYVLDEIDPADYREALRQALHGYITAHVVRDRNGVYSEESESSRKIGKPRMAGLSKFLYDREFSPARSAWVLRADVTEEDARSMAAKREATAQHFKELAVWYEAMADALRANHAVTVGDLPVMVQEVLRASRPS